MRSFPTVIDKGVVMKQKAPFVVVVVVAVAAFGIVKYVWNDNAAPEDDQVDQASPCSTTTRSKATLINCDAAQICLRASRQGEAKIAFKNCGKRAVSIASGPEPVSDFANLKPGKRRTLNMEDDEGSYVALLKSKRLPETAVRFGFASAKSG